MRKTVYLRWPKKQEIYLAGVQCLHIINMVINTIVVFNFGKILTNFWSLANLFSVLPTTYLSSIYSQKFSNNTLNK